VLGTVCGYDEGAKLLDGSIENIVYKTSECNVVALTSVEEDTDIVTVKNLLKNDKYLCMPAITQVPEAISKLREADGILLLVQAGVANGKKVEHVLHELCIHDCSVQGVILVDADEGLIKAYRMTGYRRVK
jgi:6-phosphogluconate dehydrogenase